MAQQTPAETDGQPRIVALGDAILEQFGDDIKTVSPDASSETLMVVGYAGHGDAPAGLLDVIDEYACTPLSEDVTTGTNRYVGIIETLDARREKLEGGGDRDELKPALDGLDDAHRARLERAARVVGGALRGVESGRQAVDSRVEKAFEDPADVPSDLVRARDQYREAHGAVYGKVVGDVDVEDAPDLAAANLLYRPENVEKAARAVHSLIDLFTVIGRGVSPFGAEVQDGGDYMAEIAADYATRALGKATVAADALDELAVDHPVLREQTAVEQIHAALADVTPGDIVRAEFQEDGEDDARNFCVVQIGSDTSGGNPHGYAVKMKRPRRHVSDPLYVVRIPPETDVRPTVTRNGWGDDYARLGELAGFSKLRSGTL